MNKSMETIEECDINIELNLCQCNLKIILGKRVLWSLYTESNQTCAMSRIITKLAKEI